EPALQLLRVAEQVAETTALHGLIIEPSHRARAAQRPISAGWRIFWPGAMPSSSQISEQVARESERRSRLAVPAFARGVLYFLSAIIVTSTLSSAPTVGLVQGLTPALRGEANPAVSPRAAEVKYISQHAFGLIAGSAIKAVSLILLTLVVLLLLDATRFR